MQSDYRMVIHCGNGRRVTVYREGGWQQERYVAGPGWVLADEEWPDASALVAAIRDVFTAAANRVEFSGAQHSCQEDSEKKSD